MAEPSTPPPHSARVPPPDPNWWTGCVAAYLDLRYRWLPGYLRRLHREQPKRRTLKVWQIGYEDGSETFLLAAIIDESLRSFSDDALVAFASRLTVEVRATDIAPRLARQGRRIRFDVRRGPHNAKVPLVPEDVGPRAAEQWAREVQDIESACLAGGGFSQTHLRQLGDTGKVSLLLSTILKRRAPERYEVVDRAWRIEDAAHGPPLNPRAPRRVLRFETEDLADADQRSRYDLIVCANVLPHLPLYRQRPERDLAELERICARLARATRRGGAIVVDGNTVRPGAWDRPFTARIRDLAARLAARGCLLLALDPVGLRSVRPPRPAGTRTCTPPSDGTAENL